MDASLDMVDHFRCEAVFDRGITRHTWHTSDPKRKIRRVKVVREWTTTQELGAGGFGTVWLQMEAGGDERAVKSISKSSCQWNGIDYRRELLAMSKLSRHDEYFVAFQDDRCGWYEDDQSIYLAMEYLKFGDLSSHLDAGLTELDARAIVTQILEALKIMHGYGITHRDIKPDNIFVVEGGPNWWVKVGDFGISKRATKNANRLFTEIGTPEYMAPEVLGCVQGSADSFRYGSPVDIWALGCLLYKIFTRRRPFANTLELERFCSQPDDRLVGILGAAGVSSDATEFIQILLKAQPLSRPTAVTALQSTWLTCHSSDECSVSPICPAPISPAPISPAPISPAPISPAPISPAPISPAPISPTPISPATKDDYTSHVRLTPALSHDLQTQLPEVKASMFEQQMAVYKISLLWHNRSISVNDILRLLITETSVSVLESVLEKSFRIVEKDLGQSNFDRLTHSSFDYEQALKIFPLFINSIPDINTLDSRGNAPLHVAIKGNLHGMVRFLLERGSYVETLSIDPASENSSPLKLAAIEGNLRIIQLLLQYKANVNNSDVHGLTALHAAAKCGKHLAAELLLANGAAISPRPSASQEGSGFEYSVNPLALAIANNHVSTVSLLLDHGANIDMQFSNKNSLQINHFDNGWTPLHEACYNGYHEIVQILLSQGADINGMTWEGDSPLHLASKCYLEDSVVLYTARQKVLRLLLDSGADVSLRDDRNLQPLQVAAMKDNERAVKELLEHGADINASVHNGWALGYDDTRPYALAKRTKSQKSVRVFEDFAKANRMKMRNGRWVKKQGLW